MARSTLALSVCDMSVATRANSVRDTMKKTLIFLLLFILSNCGNEAPVLTNPNYSVVIYQKNCFNMQQDSVFLSVYLNIFDENGFEDIVKMKITHIETEYSWTIPVSMFSKVIWDEKEYYGAPLLEFNGGKSILTGEYLIEVEDKSGNISQEIILVDMGESDYTKPYSVPEIKYELAVTNNNKELKVLYDKYSSCELKFLNKPTWFNGGRKKFKWGNKIILNNNKSMPDGTMISVRINKDDDEKVVYFLKKINIKQDTKDK